MQRLHITLCQLRLLYADDVSLKVAQHFGYATDSSVEHWPKSIDVPSQYAQGIDACRRACHAWALVHDVPSNMHCLNHGHFQQDIAKSLTLHTALRASNGFAGKPLVGCPQFLGRFAVDEGAADRGATTERLPVTAPAIPLLDAQALRPDCARNRRAGRRRPSSRFSFAALPLAVGCVAYTLHQSDKMEKGLVCRQHGLTYVISPTLHPSCILAELQVYVTELLSRVSLIRASHEPTTTVSQ